ncbi:DUF4405 domain-containing protein [Patescibacteria group bacterium]|nr:DUF4405 domain-containing protein [Patescibacteria group bacterium]
MNKLKWFIVVDILLVIMFISSFFSAIVISRIIPAGDDDLFWGISNVNWMIFHTFSDVIFAVLFVVHIILHWACIKENYPNGNGKH